jgi:hypothetical protein
MAQTGDKNESKYMDRNYARETQNKIRRPSTKDFMQIVIGNLLQDCLVNSDNMHVAEDIFGSNLGLLKGKTA